VVLTDVWLGWAPAIEEQAIDRVHRLGQTRNVTVKRIVIENSVEESVLITQDKKRELVGTAWQEDIKFLMTEDDVNRYRLIKDLLHLK
jgi:SWI/SNF-related matrix-associated actin-dependent regulator of chromatin subfamily A3